mmetsp:Transcript_38167/g.80707  ORF Transcript_38167/g.80707 Transcript_38167/m.80707 type:complete len:92 (+) Transcript_38167:354-629(+)
MRRCFTLFSLVKALGEVAPAFWDCSPFRSGFALSAGCRGSICRRQAPECCRWAACLQLRAPNLMSVVASTLAKDARGGVVPWCVKLSERFV